MTLPTTMRAVVTMGHGDLNQMVPHDAWPMPVPGHDEVLIKVAACGLNNTDVNTRTGWYSKAVQDPTDGAGYDTISDEDPSWGGAPIRFPRIQGADVCGDIIATGSSVDPARMGERVITDNWLRDPADPGNMGKTGYFGSERDGGFAEYTTIPSTNALAVQSDLSSAELATFSCSYSTALGMLTRADVREEDTVLVPGASGGVGGAVVQLSKLRGARVIALASEAKHEAVKALGADRVLSRTPADLRHQVADEKITVLADVVGGPFWSTCVDVLEPGGRLTTSGAIAGPMVSLDLRTLYLRDLAFYGSTIIDPGVMIELVRLIETEQLKPALAASYPLEDLHAAQTAFIEKKHTGNIVVIP